MMTGEPLFPGESDIDQLFQIVRVLGKLSPRHQILIQRNAMFKGMKQEQNTNLTQMFSNWSRDSIDFLSQCLKMDGLIRPNTTKLLRHELFVRDNFLDSFLNELQQKLSEEMQVNPLMKRIPSYGSSHSRRNSNEHKQKTTNSMLGTIKKPAVVAMTTLATATTTTTTTQAMPSSQMGSGGGSSDELKKKQQKDGKNGKNQSSTTTLMSSSSSTIAKTMINNENSNYQMTTNDGENGQENLTNEMIGKHEPSPTVDIDSMVDGTNGSGVGVSSYHKSIISSRNQLKNQINENANSENISKEQLKSKPHQIAVNNFNLKDNGKYARLLSAKHIQIKSNREKLSIDGTNNFVGTFHPTSPVQFQSLQSDMSSMKSDVIGHHHHQLKRLSPITLFGGNQATPTNSTILNGNLSQQFFNSHRRHSNVLIEPSMISMKSTSIKQPNHIPLNRTTRERGERERNSLIDISFDQNATLNVQMNKEKEMSPRTLPPPQWLTGNLRITEQGKSTQIAQNSNGKRRVTDWKTIGSNNAKYSTQNEINLNATANASDLILPNCPGATISPKKMTNGNSLKKKLPPMGGGNFPQENIYLTSVRVFSVCHFDRIKFLLNFHWFLFQRNFSASSDQINET